MGSPAYESQTDRDNEMAVANMIAERFSAEFKKLSAAKYIADYIFHRERVPVAIVEVRCRTVASNAFDTLIMSSHKIRKGQQLSEYLGVPFLIAVRWSDRVSLRRIENDERFRVEVIGRPIESRGDETDSEPCCMIPIDEKWRDVK